jgi:hypothetical protein
LDFKLWTCSSVAPNPTKSNLLQPVNRRPPPPLVAALRQEVAFFRSPGNAANLPAAPVLTEAENQAELSGTKQNKPNF